MAALVVCLLVFLAISGHSSATYCVCKDGVSEQALQKAIDYACGAGADCTPILQNGACFNPNTVKDHCNWAANSYFQRKGQAPGSCDFSNTAMTSQTSPSQSSSCVYPSSPSPGGPVNNPPTAPGTTTPTAPGTTTPTAPGTTTPGVPGTAAPGAPGTTAPGAPGTTTPGGSTTPIFGLGPTGSGIANPDNPNAGVNLHENLFLFSFTLTLLFSALISLNLH